MCYFPFKNGTIADGDQFNEIIDEYETIACEHGERSPSTYSTLAKIPYGLYKIEIDYDELLKETPPRFKPCEYYPHTDIKAMIEHSYLFRFSGPAIIWQKSELEKLFTPFVSDLYKAKKEGCKELKLVLNSCMMCR